MNPEATPEPFYPQPAPQPYPQQGDANGHAPQAPQAPIAQAFQVSESYQSYGTAQGFHPGFEAAVPAEAAMNARTAEEAPVVLTQEQVDDMLYRHVLWLDTQGAEGKRVNFRNVDLRSVNLSGANLTQASFRGAILTGVDLTNVATLQEADFTEARMNGANFSGANLRRANFSSVSAEGANFSAAFLVQANGLSGNFTLANFRQADLSHINLRQANLTAADFSDAKLNESNCRDANFSGTRMHRTQLANADLRHTQCDGADFAGADLNQTQFKDATFDGVSFTNADFSMAMEISQQYQSVNFHQEKERIVQEREEVSAMNNIYAGYAEEDRKTVLRLEKTKRTIKMLFIGWLVVLAGVIAITAMTVMSLPFEKLQIMELVVMAFSAGLITFLFAFTVLKVSSAVNILNAHITVRERQLMKAE